jgi:type II secretory pathway component GspD/PulD (secretin)
MRLFLLSVALVALAGGAVRADDTPKPRLATKVFSVGDLVTPIPDIVPAAANGKGNGETKQLATVAEQSEKLIKFVTAMVRPTSWNTEGGSGTIEFFETGCTLVVNNTPDAIGEVEALLTALRRLQDVNIVSEMRVLSLPVGMRERLGIKLDGESFLTERELQKLLEAAQGNRDASVMQLPKITTFDGQTATVKAGEEQSFVTGVDLVKVDGANVLVPKNQPVNIGDAMTLCARSSADGKFVKLRVNFTRTSVAGEVELVPVVTQITPVEGGARGKPVPFTQYLQAPDVKTQKIDKTIMLPSGGAVVLGGWKESVKVAKPLPQSNIPYLKKLFKNLPEMVDREVIVLATTRIIRTSETEVSAGSRVDRAVGRLESAFQLRNVAAADAAQAVNGYLVSNNQNAVVVAEPVSNTVLVAAEEAVAKQVAKMLTELDAAPVQTHIEAIIAEVPQNFLADIGMKDDAEKVLALTPRERSMFEAALRKEKPKVDILSHPVFVTQDNRPGTVQVGGTTRIPAGIELTSAAGGLTVSQKMVPVEQGVRATITPRGVPGGKEIDLEIEAKVSTISSQSGITVPLTLPPEITGMKEPVTYQVQSSGAVNEQSTRASVRLLDGQTAIVRCGVRKEKGDDVGRETLLIVTAHPVKNLTAQPAAATPQPQPAAPVPAGPAPTPKNLRLGSVGGGINFHLDR